MELPAQSKRVCFELTRLRNLCVRCFQRRPSVVCDPSVAGAQFRIPPGEGRKGRTGGKGQNQVHEIYGRQIIIHIKYYIWIRACVDAGAGAVVDVDVSAHLHLE